MSILATLKFIIFVISIFIFPAYGQQEKILDDNLCPQMISVLCVKKVLLDIVFETQKMKDSAHKIEKYIHDHEPTPASLVEYINYTMKHMKSNLPKSYYHYHYRNTKSNINRTDFIHLIQEENYAFSYLYNSINNILNIKHVFGRSIDELLEKISNNLKINVLCNYRNIFHVYSESWLPISKINGIQILTTRKRKIPPLLHHAYSIIIIRLLEEWIANANHIIANIDSKYFR
ncbi:unnamed protein product [Rotaria magnacalcarata]|uniref:Uncharacterized protein n=2 Tax=Rotaria magnacalcarata TaxID=392030 RepID=A0A814Y378_9BILA|nr:unnamed protein product [Rotaria magnacalcarata]CAF2040145.1 unnamed protein product [Rotaria magnacalcarata]CAF2130896.1 unnamed protein product [Rotaria magnacalcarata]CAF4046406.1 unnamed protein product [Rotaria magnacalcarata]